ncbi:hypothetical protein PBAC_15390 [Pedobacter glucosidilyticus]|nr:hypothetical protein PBAC_15390 [Pedobacter glucosidilyticus]
MPLLNQAGIITQFNKNEKTLSFRWDGFNL